LRGVLRPQGRPLRFRVEAYGDASRDRLEGLRKQEQGRPVGLPVREMNKPLRGFCSGSGRVFLWVRDDLVDCAFEPGHAADLWLSQFPQGLAVGVTLFAPPADCHGRDGRPGAFAYRFYSYAAIREAVYLEFRDIEDAPLEVAASKEFTGRYTHQLPETVDREGLGTPLEVGPELYKLVEGYGVLGRHGADNLSLDPSPAVRAGYDRLKLFGDAVADS
jgi:hypothetical protein